MAKRVCVVCGSKKWRKNSTGQVVCDEGHLLENYRNETIEKDDLGPHAVRKRATKKRKARKQRVYKDPNLYLGSRSRFLYWQCLQLIMRKQMKALMRLWDLPPEFEIICRDLWALHLRLLPRPPPPELLDYAREQGLLPEVTNNVVDAGAESEPKNDSISSSSLSSSSSDEAQPNEKDAEADAKPGSDSDTESDTDTESSGEAEIQRMMKEADEDDIEDDEDEEADAEAAGKSKAAPQSSSSKKAKYRNRPEETPLGNLAILVIACMMMRLPIMYRDFTELILQYELPYTDLIRRGTIPADMLRHLNMNTAFSLSPNFAPTVSSLHELSTRLARLLHTQFGISTPEASSGPLLWRTVRALGGGGATPLYAMTKRIARELALPLTLHAVLAPQLERTRALDPKAFALDGIPPELALVGAAIVALKLVYGLSGINIARPDDVNGAAAAMPAFKHFMRSLEAAQHEHNDRLRHQFDPASAMAAEDLDDVELDALLELCEKALLAPSDEKRDEEDDMARVYFPRRETVTNDVVQTLSQKTDVANDRTDEHDDDDDSNDARPTTDGLTGAKPGAVYELFSAGDVFGTVPKDLEVVVKRAARFVGVDEYEVYGVVEGFERRLLRLHERPPKREGLEERREDGKK